MAVAVQDREVLRELGRQIAQIAALPIQQERRELHARIERMERAKPTILIYQEPWNELAVSDELTLRCGDEFLRGIEWTLRCMLYSWNHMPGDMVVNDCWHHTPCYDDTDFGITEDADIVKTDEDNGVVSRHFNIQISRDEDIQKIQFPRLTLQPQRTARQLEMLHEVFDGVLPVRSRGVTGFWFAPWDEIVRWTGVETVLMDMAERPDYVHRIIARMVDAWLCRLDQCEALGLLEKPARQMWGVGAAQIFAAVSPAMHEEFALRHEARWFERFGPNYYGCCEPLHHKVDILRRNIPRLRKISMSPWVDFPKAVSAVGKEFIFAWKPNPAVLAANTWNPAAVRKDMREKLAMARECVVEIHMKDISTVRHQPQRLWEWAKIAQEVTAEFA